MNQPQEGNRLILMVLALGLAIASLFVQWGVITLSGEDLTKAMVIDGQKMSGDMGGLLGGIMSSIMSEMKFPVNGMNSHLSLGPLKIPNWLMITSAMTGIVFIFTNSTGFSAIPSKVIFGLLALGITAGLWFMILVLTNGAVGVGALLLIVASVIGFSLQKSSLG